MAIKRTAESILARYRKDYPKLHYQASKIINKVKHSGYYYHKWHNPEGDKYRIVINIMKNGKVCHMITPVDGIKGHRGFYIVDDYEDHKGQRGMVHITDHYIRRYYQRAMQRNIFNEENALKHYYEHNVTSVIIWKNDDFTELIYATNTGLSLCRRDPSTDICHLCTFVSLRQLHTEQREAYNKVKDILQSDEMLYKSGLSYSSEEFKFLDKLTDMAADELSSCSQKIIQQYKDEMNISL